MKIAMLTYPLGLGGGAVHVYELSKELLKQGHDVTIIHRPGAIKIKIEPFLQVEPAFTFRIPHLKGILSFVSFMAHLSKSVYDVVHVHEIYRLPPILSAILMKKLRKIPIVCTIHSFGPPSWYWHPIKRVLMWYAFKNVDVLIAVSGYLKLDFTRYYPKELNNIVVINNGVDINRFNPSNNGKLIREKLGVVGKYVIFCVGRPSPSKGLVYLIRAMTTIIREAGDAVLIIAGVGAMKKLESLTRKLSLENRVKFIGFVPYQEIPSYYAACDVFILPSIYEAFGIVLLEAMSTGKPVIASRIGGIPEIVRHNENGLLVEPRSPKDIAEAVLRLYNDVDLASRMGQAGRTYVKKYFTWEHTAKCNLAIYKKLIVKPISQKF